METAAPLPSFEELLLEVGTEMQRQFCREYLVDLIATRAAKRAGYAEGSAAVEGSRLLRKAHIRAAVDAGLRELGEDAHVSRAWVLQRLKLNAVEAHEKGELQASNRALTTLAKAIGLLDKDLNVNLRSDVGARVVMYFPDNQRGPKTPKGIEDGNDESDREGSRDS